MYFGEDRPVGYPAFLWLIHSLTHSYQATRYLQLILLCISLGLLAYSFRLNGGPLFLSLLLELVLFANPGLLMLADQIMADSLSAACVALLAAATVALWRGARPSLIWALIALAAFAPLLRPVNIAFTPAVFCAILLYGRRLTVPRWAQAGLLVVAVLIAQQATPLAHALRHDSATITNPVARGLFQKTLFRQWPADAASGRCEGALIARDTAAIDAWLEQAPPTVKQAMENLYSGYLRFIVIIPEIVAIHHFENFSEADPILECYAMDRIKQDPGYFLRDVVDQFVRFLTYSTFVSQQRHDEIERYVAANPPPMPPPVARDDKDFQLRARALADTGSDQEVFTTIDTHFTVPKARPQLLRLGLVAIQIAAAAGMLAGMVAVLLALLRQRAGGGFAAAGLMGIVFYGEMLITAVIEIAVPRYVLPLWPLICASLLATFLALWEITDRRSKSEITDGTAKANSARARRSSSGLE